MSQKPKPLALGIAGSPRRHGNSTSLLKAYLKGAASQGFETEVVHLNDWSFHGCRACDLCVKGKDCPIQDDLTPVLTKIRRASIWALASPVYYDGFSGPLKTFFDRLRFTTYDPHKLVGPRRGIIILTYADKENKGYLKTAKSLAKYFTWNQRGDFGEILIASEANLSAWNDWKKRPDLQRKLADLGRAQTKELLEIFSHRD